MNAKMSRKPAAGRRRRTQEERSSETRQRLIGAAIAAIAELGYPAATTALIAERASVTRGALQYHFTSKSDLTVAIMEEIAVELNFRFDVAALQREPLESRIETMIEHYWRVFQGPMFRAGLGIWLAVGSDAELAGRLEKYLDGLRKEIAAVWQELFRDAPCSKRELRSVLHLVLAAMRGSAITFAAGRNENASREDRRQLRLMALDAIERLSIAPKRRRRGEA